MPTQRPLDWDTLGRTPIAASVDFPLAASPRGVYKLAHLLEMPELEALALDDFKSQLTSDNVLYQLTTDLAFYDPVRDALVNFAVENWSAVRDTSIFAELRKMHVLDSHPNPALIGASLAEMASKL